MPESKSEPQRICLFGGTFDPIHCAHLRIAEAAAQLFELEVLFVPAAAPPHKTGQQITPYEDRFRMVEIACASYPFLKASRLEDRPGRSYTIDTVQRFRATLHPGSKLFFLIGADAFRELSTWKDWRELLNLIEFIVVSRPGERYEIPAGASVHRLDEIELAVSSSDIRARLAEGKLVEEIPAPVRAYIEKHGLYRWSKPAALQ